MKLVFRVALTCVLFVALTPGAWAAQPASVARGPVSVPDAMSSAETTRSIIVGYDSRGESQAIGSATRLGAKTAHRAKRGGLVVVQVPPGTDVAQFVARLSDQPGVKFAEQDSLVYEAEISNDIGFPHQWALPKIGAPAAWDVSEGASVRVAVVDSGVDLSHQDLLGRIDAAAGYDFVNHDSTPQDDDGHGTHVAGIIGATLNNGVGIAGVANKCTIIPVKVMNAAGTGSSSNVAEGIYWAADKGADVINLSLGAPISSVAIETAVQYAVSKDCVVVAASGNEGSSQVFYPAAAPNVIGVGATDKNDVRPGFSNYGPRVDISAPGLDIYSTWPGGNYRWGSGTSMSAPHVSGVVALIRAKNPSWNRTMVERQLLGTALDLGAVGRDDYYGYGRVQADRALMTTVTAGTLQGRVTFRGAPFAGVVVSVPDCPAVLTNADGTYVVPDVTPFIYGVTFSKSGYEDQTIGVSIPDGGTAVQDVALRARVTLSTPKVYGRPSAKRGTILRGSVRPAQSALTVLQVRRSVRGHWRMYRSYSVRVNQSGAWYARPKLKKGTYSIRMAYPADSNYTPGVSAWRKVVVK